jgi:hypothetical protein
MSAAGRSRGCLRFSIFATAGWESISATASCESERALRSSSSVIASRNTAAFAATRARRSGGTSWSAREGAVFLVFRRSTEKRARIREVRVPSRGYPSGCSMIRGAQRSCQSGGGKTGGDRFCAKMIRSPMPGMTLHRSDQERRIGPISSSRRTVASVFLARSLGS